MDSTALGGNVDLVADFKRGVDKIDAVVYRQAPDRFDFHQGGFEAFDTDGNGRLDDRDQFVTVAPESFRGLSKESITLDVGAANLAAGRLSQAEIEAGPHSLTIWGESVLRASDFVPTNTYRLAGGRGTSDNDWFAGGAGGSVIDGRAGDDLMTGGGGRDTFTSRYTATEQPGADRIADFLRGEDLLDGWFSMGPDGPSGDLNFAALDDNANGVLDDGDRAVRVAEASAFEPGEAPRSGTSTAIDLDVAYGFASDWTGAHSVTIMGVTGLTGEDFVDPGASSVA
jgi:RTX calcium-binding nonapeptide repeat (4 copies)